MSNKRNITTILAIAGATVLAAGGSAFVTQTGLSLTDSSSKAEQGSEVAVNEKETEQPPRIHLLLSRSQIQRKKIRKSLTVQQNQNRWMRIPPERIAQ